VDVKIGKDTPETLQQKLVAAWGVKDEDIISIFMGPKKDIPVTAEEIADLTKRDVLYVLLEAEEWKPDPAVTVQNIPLKHLKLESPIEVSTLTRIYKCEFQEKSVLVKKFKDAVDLEALINTQEAILKMEQHSALLKIVGVCNEKSLIVLENAKGTLSTLMNKNSKSHVTLSERRKIRICRSISRVMQHAHNSNLVHGDLNPENVFLTRDLKVKVDAFSSCNYLSKQNYIRRRVDYLAPEVLQGKPSDASADVYSFGILLWELFSEFYPYLEQNLCGISLIFPVCSGVRPNLELVANCPAVIKDLMVRCWDTTVENRPSFKSITEELSAL